MSGPRRGNTSEAQHRAVIKAKEHRDAVRTAEAEAVRSAYEEAQKRGLSTTVAAIRAAREERRAEEAVRKARRDMDAARRVVGGGEASGFPVEARGLTVDMIYRGFDLAAVKNRKPTREEVCMELPGKPSAKTLYRAQEDLGIPGWPPRRAR